MNDYVQNNMLDAFLSRRIDRCTSIQTEIQAERFKTLQLLENLRVVYTIDQIKDLCETLEILPVNLANTELHYYLFYNWQFKAFDCPEYDEYDFKYLEDNDRNYDIINKLIKEAEKYVPQDRKIK